MVGTLFSLIITGYLLYNPLPLEIGNNLSMVGVIFALVAILFLAIQTLTTMFAWGPLQKIEQNITPRAMKMFHEDTHLKYTNALLLVFLLASFLVAIDMVFLDIGNKKYLLMGWTIAFGVAIDILHYHIRRVMHYLDPYKIVDMLGDRAIVSIKQELDVDLCEWIDALAEVALKGVKRESTSLVGEALGQMLEAIQFFLDSERSVLYHEDEVQSEELGIQDMVSYNLFNLFQKLEQIFDKAMAHDLDTVGSDVISTLGKVVIAAAKYDMTMTTYPLHYIGKLSHKALDLEAEEVSNRSLFTLQELARLLVHDFDVSYVSLKEPYFSLIAYMQEISERTFKRDKEIDINILIQPFIAIREVFQEKKIKDHQDAPVIVENLNVVIDEFETLRAVMAAKSGYQPAEVKAEQ